MSTGELQAAQQAASSVQLLLSEDPALADLLSSTDDDAVYAYASSPAAPTLNQVEGKLALAESLAAKVSRTSPEAVTRHFLQLHNSGDKSLPAFRDAAQSLERQADSLLTTATRVSTVLEKQYNRLPVKKLERCLEISSTLKKLLRMQFELQKVRDFDLDDDIDLTKAAASVAILEQLIDSIPDVNAIHVVTQLQPDIRRYSHAVRQSAASKQKTDIAGYLQIHFHLGSLGQAVWKLMDQAHDTALAQSDWVEGCRAGLDAVREMERVVAVKTDAVTRMRYKDVVAEAPRPPTYPRTASLRLAFWDRYCHALADKVMLRMSATAYPQVRAQALEILGRHVVGKGDDGTQAGGVLGGQAYDAFLLSGTPVDMTTTTSSAGTSWTTKATAVSSTVHSDRGKTNVTAIFNSPEWKLLANVGLRGLEQSFVDACQERLLRPVRLLFPDDNNIIMDDAVVSTTPALPSKYDIQRLDETIRSELKLADPQDGGDTTLVTMIAECVVISVAEFCERAPFGANSRGSYIEYDWSATEDFQNDRKIVAILYALQNYLNKAPEATFVTPYQPSILEQHREAAKLCDMALKPAFKTIDTAIQNAVLLPLLGNLKKKLGEVLSRVVSSSYNPAFCQTVVGPALEQIQANTLKRLPPRHASFVAHQLAEFAIRTFVTATTLVRPLDEDVRLHITQDLGDLELALQDLVDEPLSNAVGAYAELRACRQMLFWTGLTGSSAPASDLARSLLGQHWLQDVRPSTAFHYLISSFGPELLSSPHHAVNMGAAAYVAKTVSAGGEDSAWVAVSACCDSYQQRQSTTSTNDGDARVAQIVTLIGRELVRRRGRN